MVKEINPQPSLCFQCANTHACSDQFKEEVRKEEFCEMKKHWSKYLDKCEA